MSYEYFRVTNFTDLMGGTLRGKNVQGFDTRWDEVLLSVKDMLQDNVLQSLYRMRIRDSEQLKTVLALYDRDIEQKDILPSYQKLKTMAMKFLHQKMRNRNLEVRDERTAAGTPAKSGSNGDSTN